jgi:2-iminobutanoate/2-iminopropanoate deaminase
MSLSISTTDAPPIVRAQPGVRFSQTVIHNGIVYLSGQVCRGVKDDAAAQTRGILARIDDLLAEAGTSKANILSCTIWLADIEQDVDAMNREWDLWVDRDNMPVRACLESKLVDDEITVEIQATAALPQRPRASIVSTTEAAAAVGPYNQAVRMRDGTCYISGCIGLTSAGEFAGPSVEEQTKQCLSNLAAILKASGPNGQIVKTTLLLHDMADFAAVNKIYEAFFSPGGLAAGPVPARACFSAKTLPKGALVEIEAIAVVDC